MSSDSRDFVYFSENKTERALHLSRRDLRTLHSLMFRDSNSTWEHKRSFGSKYGVKESESIFPSSMMKKT